jgi:hypothetical protein
LIDFERTHSKVYKTVKNNVGEYNRTDMAGENLRKILGLGFF